MRPSRRAVWSPSIEADQAWAHSCTQSEKMRRTNSKTALRNALDCKRTLHRSTKTQSSTRARFGSHAVGRECAHRLAFRHMMAAEHDRMAGDAGAWTNDGWHESDSFEVLRIVGVGIDAREGANDRTLADGEASAVVKQGSLANCDSVADGEVVAETEFDAVIDFDPRSPSGRRCDGPACSGNAGQASG